ncbi:MAG: hypothetical protein U0694_18910 [Anaerolineae bacterium]
MRAVTTRWARHRARPFWFTRPAQKNSLLRVAMAATGNIIVWTHQCRSPITTFTRGILMRQARHFSAAFRNRAATGIQGHPAVTWMMRGDMSWFGRGLVLATAPESMPSVLMLLMSHKCYSSMARPSLQNAAYVTMSGDGNFLVTWEHDTNTYTHTHV